MTGTPLPRTRLEQLVQQRRRTRAEFRADFKATATRLDEQSTVSERHVCRWLEGRLDGLPHASACRVLEALFGEPAEALFGPPVEEGRSTPARSAAAGSSRHDDFGRGSESAYQEVVAVAAESARFGQFAEQSNVGPHTLEQFRADLDRIVTTYPNRPVYPTFVELRELRNRAFELLEGRQHPEQSRELYLVGGLLCGLLANASFDLGWLPAAETQARTAFLCAELAGNNALRVWVRGTQSLIAYWDDRPRNAVELAADGWRYAPERGTARVRLAAIEARAHARLRDQRATDQALLRATDARDAVHGDDDPAGMLAFPVAKQTFYTASAELWLGGPAAYAAAERHAAESISQYESEPPERRRLGELCLAKLDLASARLAQDDLDGTSAELQDVLGIAGNRRTHSVARHLRRLGNTLDRPRYQTTALALDMRDEIRSFTATPTAPALPGAAR